MPHRESKPIGEYGYIATELTCVICKKKFPIRGYFLRDYEGYPLNKQGQRLDHTFPDGSVEQGMRCQKCHENLLNKIPLVKNKKTGKWTWQTE